MLRNTVLSATFGVLLGWTASTAFAQDLPAIPDSDGDGLWSQADLQAVFPDLGAEAFVSIDANADGRVDRAELAAAVADGAVMVPAAN